jgi:hypothetical protein
LTLCLCNARQCSTTSIALQAAAAAEAEAAREREAELRHELDKARSAAKAALLRAEGIDVNALQSADAEVNMRNCSASIQFLLKYNCCI